MAAVYHTKNKVRLQLSVCDGTALLFNVTSISDILSPVINLLSWENKALSNRWMIKRCLWMLEQNDRKTDGRTDDKHSERAGRIMRVSALENISVRFTGGEEGQSSKVTDECVLDFQSSTAPWGGSAGQLPTAATDTSMRQSLEILQVNLLYHVTGTNLSTES